LAVKRARATARSASASAKPKRTKQDLNSFPPDK
jgi:hypothetical protein